jgi:hypothetical protein
LRSVDRLPPTAHKAADPKPGVKAGRIGLRAKASGRQERGSVPSGKGGGL